MSGISALNIAKDSLLSHQTAINVTGSNIANVNTEGYTRQRPIFCTVGSSNIGAGQVQYGVEVDQIQRIYDQFITYQIHEQNQDIGYTEAKKEQLERIEIILNETTGEGIDDLFNKFWNAWEDLSANPSGQTEREALVSVTQSLTYVFRSYSSELVTLQKDVNSNISALVDTINSDLSSIAALNQKITQNATGKGDTNIFRDERDKIVKELAGIIEINYFEDASGALNIFISNGLALVEEGRYNSLAVETNEDTYYDIIFEDAPGVAINSNITTGKIAGLLEIRDTTTVSYLSSLNTLAAELVQEVNDKHQEGFDTSGNLGGNFFDATKTTALTIEVDAAIIADVNKIAASETVNGDGNNALNIAGLRDELVLNSGSSTFIDYYSSFIGTVGQDVLYADRAFEHNTDLMEQLTSKRESVSGVSIDEEMMSLIKYQTGYTAAARLCTTVQALVDDLLGLVG
ncbi:MAG: flagellar hook-associated protein FlgK [Planctomycetaceae bacterium]|nr:MAG: flagellar hook-associated protein FlgK [Planctomycetaceae bacterium]